MTSRDEVVRPRRQHAFAAHLLQPQIQRVDLLPHVGADLLAHLPRVVARGGDAGHHRAAIARVEHQRVDQLAGIERRPGG